MASSAVWLLIVAGLFAFLIAAEERHPLRSQRMPRVILQTSGRHGESARRGRGTVRYPVGRMTSQGLGERGNGNGQDQDRNIQR